LQRSQKKNKFTKHNLHLERFIRLKSPGEWATVPLGTSRLTAGFPGWLPPEALQGFLLAFQVFCYRNQAWLSGMVQAYQAFWVCCPALPSVSNIT